MAWVSDPDTGDLFESARQLLNCRKYRFHGFGVSYADYLWRQRDMMQDYWNKKRAREWEAARVAYLDRNQI